MKNKKEGNKETVLLPGIAKMSLIGNA